VSRFGVPVHVTTDRGPQFTSSRWRDWCLQHGVHHITTTAFHPQSNGMIERLHRQLKDGLRARQADKNWDDHLPWVLLGIRSAPKDEAAVSAAEAVLGQQLNVPGQPHEGASGRGGSGTCPPAALPAASRTYADAVKGLSGMEVADWVFIRKGGAVKPLEDKYEGPFRVLKMGEKIVHVLRGDKEEAISRDRAKPYQSSAEPRAAQPRRRGRPPGTGGVECDPQAVLPGDQGEAV